MAVVKTAIKVYWRNLLCRFNAYPTRFLGVDLCLLLKQQNLFNIQQVTFSGFDRSA